MITLTLHHRPHSKKLKCQVYVAMVMSDNTSFDMCICNCKVHELSARRVMKEDVFIKAVQIRGVGTKHKVQGVAEGKTLDAPDGVKKVWGTMRGCSYKTVLSTLQQLQLWLKMLRYT